MAGFATAELAAMLEQVATMTPARDDADRIDRIRHFEQLKAALAAAQMTTAVELADSRRASDAALGVPVARQGRSVAGEIALARRISPAQGQRWLGLARILRSELPATFAHLAAGRVSEWRATLVARETIFLSREHRLQVDADLAPRLGRLGDRQVAGEARRAAQRLDPSGAAQRARNAVNDRRTSLRPAPDTMCWLSALLPVEQGVAAYAALGKHADTAIGTGTQGANPDGSLRSRGQVMADTLVERVTGRASAADIDVEVNLVMTDNCLFDPAQGEAEAGDSTDDATDDPTADEPAFVLGYGPVPGPIARELALGSPDSAARRSIRRLFLSPDGSRLVDIDSRRREFTAAQRRFIRLRDQDTCRTPWCNAPIRHIDHVEDWARSKRTRVAAAQGYCARCNFSKQAPGWRTRIGRDGSTIITTTPTGHLYYSHAPAPPGARSRPPASASPVVRRLRELIAGELLARSA